MFEYYKHKQIDLEKWDICINDAKNGIFYAASWYLNLTSPGWDAIIKEEDGKYVAVLPVTLFRKFNLSYLRQPFFSQQLGLFYIREVSEKEFLTTIELLKERFNQISGYSFNIDNTKYFKKSAGFLTEEDITYLIDLSNDYGSIAQNYSSYRKIKLRKAGRSDLTVKSTTEVDPVIDLFKQNVAQKIYGGVKKPQYKLLKNIFLKAKENNSALILSAFNNSGKIVSSTFFLINSKSIIYLFNATNAEGKKKNAASLTIDEVIKRYSGTARVFDFEGSNIPSIAKFYESFGSKKQVFYSISYSKLPLLIKVVKGFRIRVAQLFFKR